MNELDLLKPAFVTFKTDTRDRCQTLVQIYQKDNGNWVWRTDDLTQSEVIECSSECVEKITWIEYEI